LIKISTGWSLNVTIFLGSNKRDLPKDGLVRIEDHSREDIPHPHPILLETHVALAKILNASGQGVRINKFLRDREEIQCLATDGSSNLQSLLWGLIQLG
jgi:hypothetical protein